MTTDTISPAVERVARLNPSDDTPAATIRMALGIGFTETDVHVCFEYELVTVDQADALLAWLRTHQATAGTIVGGRR